MSGKYILALGAYAWYRNNKREKALAANRSDIILTLDFSKTIPESRTSLLAFISQATGSASALTHYETITAIERAVKDQRVRGIVCNFSNATISLAQAQELTKSLQKLKSVDPTKFSYAFADTFIPHTPSLTPYYLASTSCSHIATQPSAELSLVPPFIHDYFFKSFFDKFNIQAEFTARREYKNFANRFIYSEFTKEHKEAMMSLYGDLYQQIVKGIGEGRGMKETEVVEIMKEGPFMGVEAKEKRLIDDVMYETDLIKKLELDHVSRIKQRIKERIALHQGGSPRDDQPAPPTEPPSMPSSAPPPTSPAPPIPVLPSIPGIPGRPSSPSSSSSSSASTILAASIEHFAGGAVEASWIARISSWFGGGEKSIDSLSSSFLPSIISTAASSSASPLDSSAPPLSCPVLPTSSILPAGEVAAEVSIPLSQLKSPRILPLQQYYVENVKVPKAELMSVSAPQPALSPFVPPPPPPHKIALLYGVGQIEGQSSDTSAFTSRSMIKQIRRAAADPGIGAIVIRVDSPGGDAFASDSIYQALVEAKTKRNKKIIVSMGNVCASGGYYIAAPADRIFSSPGTITGSIGVIAGKFALNPALDHHLSIKTDSFPLEEGAENGRYYTLDPMGVETRKKFEERVDTIYEQFKKKVADGRGMSMEEVEKIAKGRVWTGRQAAEIGLVDELGGLKEAIEHAKSLLLPSLQSVPPMPGSTPRSDVIVETFPRLSDTLRDAFISEGRTLRDVEQSGELFKSEGGDAGGLKQWIGFGSAKEAAKWFREIRKGLAGMIGGGSVRVENLGMGVDSILKESVKGASGGPQISLMMPAMQIQGIQTSSNPNTFE